MLLIESSTVQRYTPEGTNTDDLITRFLTPALAILNEVTCNAITSESTGSVPGIVQGDGITITIPAWATSVQTVSLAGRELAFTFMPNRYDLLADGSTGTHYGNTLTLNSEQNTGTIVDVTCTHGFNPLPDSLVNTLTGIMLALQTRLDGTDRITSKSIEDVSVSISDRSNEKPAEIPLDVFAAAADLWSLCEAKPNTGMLGFPRKHYELPYWLPGSDIWGGDNAYGSVR